MSCNFNSRNNNLNNCKQCECSKVPDGSKIKGENSQCCCYKKPLRESLELLSVYPFNNFINFSSFTLYGQSYSTSKGSTVLKSVVSCNYDLIEYTDNGPFNTSSLCDLVAYSFQLLNPFSNLPLFLDALTNCLFDYSDKHRACANKKTSCICVCDSDSCCCNKGKIAKLDSLLGPINLFIKGTVGSLLNSTILAVHDEIVWVSVTTTTGSPSITSTTIYAIPVCNIEFFG